jgi:hypothetical protein
MMEIRVRENPAQRRGAALFPMVVIALLCVPLNASAQQAPGPQAQQESLATFASRLKAEVVDYQVKLTWKDAPDVTGSYRVYRAAEEITAQNIGRAQLVGIVDQGVEAFIDTPPDQRDYFYAVVVQDTAGKLYSLPIPFRNKTSVAVSARTAAPEEKLAARINGIKAAATPSGDGVDVTFAVSNASRDLLLFWGTAPLSTPEDLLSTASATQLDPGVTHYVLPVLPGVDYWFAVLDAGMYKIGKAVLEKGVNATASPVQVPIGGGRISLPPPVARRALRLPSLSLSFGVQSGLQLPDPSAPGLPSERNVSKPAERSILLLMNGVNQPATKERNPRILPSDATPMPGGELARLQEIVTGPFRAGDMASAQRMLTDFLRLPRTAQLQAHARFYLGQTYYFQEKARDALIEFLLSEDYYYQDAQPWKDACFEKLELAEE